MPFIVRIKKNHQVNGMRADEFRHQKRYKSIGIVNIWGLKFHYGAKSIHKRRDSHLYVISNKFEAKDALKIYKQRWAIELLFSHLKKRGFNLEDNHMTDGVKLERLFGIVTLSFFARSSWGLMLSSLTKLTVAEQRKSVFRLDLESLMELFDRRLSTPQSESIPIDLRPDLELSPHPILARDFNPLMA